MNQEDEFLRGDDYIDNESEDEQTPEQVKKDRIAKTDKAFISAIKIITEVRRAQDL